MSGAGSGAVRSKTTPTDPVTVVDTETERLLRDRLAQLRPGDPILGEEGGGPADPAATPADAVTWVLDPIDGTVNFVYGIPAYAVSVGAQINGVSVAGAVADVVAGRVYSAATGLGAHVIDDQGTEPLRCAAVDDLSMALLGTGFGYSRRRRASQAALLAHMLPVVRDVRRIGSAALDLCMVAAGRLDAFYEHGLQVWDRAAGALIAAEAGARVCGAGAERPGGQRRIGGGRRPRNRRRAAGGPRRRLQRPRAAAGLSRSDRAISSCWRESLAAVRDPTVRWRRDAGWRAPRRCRRCGPAR